MIDSDLVAHVIADLSLNYDTRFHFILKVSYLRKRREGSKAPKR